MSRREGAREGRGRLKREGGADQDPRVEAGEPRAGQGADDSPLASLLTPRPGPAGGLGAGWFPGALTLPHCSEAQRGEGLARSPGWREKCPVPAPPSPAALTDRTGGGRGEGGGSPSCTLSLPKPGVLRDPGCQPLTVSAVPATAGRQVSASRPLPRGCSSRTACPDRRPLSPPCRQVTPGHPDGPVRPGSGALRGPQGWRSGPLLPGDARPCPASRGGQLQARPPATTASGNVA